MVRADAAGDRGAVAARVLAVPARPASFAPGRLPGPSCGPAGDGSVHGPHRPRGRPDPLSDLLQLTPLDQVVDAVLAGGDEAQPRIQPARGVVLLHVQADL